MNQILIVEDDIAIAEVMQLSLCLAGYKVRKALDASEMYSALAHSVPDLIIIDLRLGEENGNVLSTALRSSEQFAVVPIIITSAWPITDQEKAALSCDAFLTKPFDLLYLENLVEEVLSQNAGKRRSISAGKALVK